MSDSIVNWHPWPGLFIAVLGFLGVLVPLIRERIGPKEKAAWTLLMLALLGLEVRSLKLAAKDFEKDRSDQNDRFGSIAEGLKTTVDTNQQQFSTTMSKMQALAALSKRQIGEATGGDSFCYVDLAIDGNNPSKLVMSLDHKGRYPVFDLDINIADLQLADKQLADTAAWRRSIAAIPVITRSSLYRPLSVYIFGAQDQKREFNIFMHARNGTFTELARIQKLPQGGLATAVIVSASFLDKSGIVLSKVDKEFPTQLLERDGNWQEFTKLPWIRVIQ